jgi:leucyl aminopeptidase (aminopeptidase T)
MQRLRTPGVVVIVLAAVLALPYTPAAQGPNKETSPGVTTLAKKLVTHSARVKDGDVVLIGGGARDVELMEALALETAKTGGDWLIMLMPGDATSLRLYTDVPAKFDTRASAMDLKLAETITVRIFVEYADSERSSLVYPPSEYRPGATCG